ncbi:hypothetical protein OHB41_10160 [Streptomyces sp. NBC_01571]|uniref:hypothetical protein n=1 Tax=Streptomyces sp. NBC_01571 TaxID=2975883 RepID=UPI002257B4F9|nr:hypothetical protein [Streptomyces sp. NBC_01571]MCX4573539.1 hypothetical protein [Streptomyces sp. NBC_01571]
MARLTEDDKDRNEAAIRTAMDQILSGNLPPGGKADLKTLAALAGVARTGFYPRRNRDNSPRPGAYQHLAEEFERRVKQLQDAGEIVDPRTAQIERLRTRNAELRERLTRRDEKIAELTEFQTLAISRLAAQHEEIQRLRTQLAADGTVRSLHTPASGTAPYGSCS